MLGTCAKGADQPGIEELYFSFAMRSKLERSRASDILLTTYCPARYVAPTTPAAIASPLRFRRSQRRVADIMASGKQSWLSGYRGSLESMMMRKVSNCCMGALIIVLLVDTRRRMHDELVGPGQFTCG